LTKKSVAELKTLADAGLRLAYLGAESGDDEVLARVNKGETFESTRAALDKLGEAGITRSVMILNGLGGEALSAQHADNSARLINATRPEYLSTLVVTLHDAGRRFLQAWPDWQALSQQGLFREMERFLAALDSSAPCSAPITPPTGWCSRARWARTRQGCWRRCAPRSHSPSRRRCARPGCADFEPLPNGGAL
jgi:Fe-S oxidoreductase